MIPLIVVVVPTLARTLRHSLPAPTDPGLAEPSPGLAGP